MPRLYGAPAYGRPPAPVSPPPKPFDPDDLPIEVEQTEEERAFVATLPPEAFVRGIRLDTPKTGHRRETEPRLRPRPFSLKAIAGKLIREG